MNGPVDVRPPVAFWRGVVSLCRFDLRRFRVAVGVVVGLELVRAGVVEWLLRRPLLALEVLGGDNGRGQPQALDIALSAATLLVAAAVIQADHPTDERAFWRSRPIDPWQLAVAKLTLLAGLFILLPASVNVARLAAYGAPADAIIASAWQFAVTGGGVLVPTCALALVARAQRRFIAVAVGLAVAWLTASAVIVAYRPVAVVAARVVGEDWIREAKVAPPPPDWQRLETRGWTFALLMTLGGAACVASYYRTRRPLLPATAALMLVALPSALPDAAPDPAPAGIANGPIAIDGPLLLPPRFSLSDRISSPQTMISGRMRLPARPSNLTSRLRLGPVRVVAGTAVPATGVEYCCVFDSPAAALAAAWGTVPPDLTLSPDPPFVFMVANADVPRLRDRVVDVDAAARLLFMRHDLAGDVPLRAGQSFRTPDYLLEILDVDRRAQTALCRLARFPTLTSPRPQLSFYAGSRHSLVVDVLSWWREEPRPGGDGSIGGRRGRDWVTLLTLPLRHVPRDGQAAARLYIVESRPAGQLQTTIVGRALPVIQPATDADALKR